MKHFGEILSFVPQYKERIWGGNKIKTAFDRHITTNEPIGESWEISGLDGSVSVVSKGIHKGKTLNELIAEYPENILGKSVVDKYGETFPLLVKILDAHSDLSIQVHPDDDQAKAQGEPFGKSEMWYILDAEEEAEISAGLTETQTKDSLREHIEQNTLTDIMNTQKVERNDLIYMPAGTLHSIGRGNTILEIQQSSDVTYRVFDFNRPDKNGKLRELHIDEAIEVAELEENTKGNHIQYDRTDNNVAQAITNELFNVEILNCTGITQRSYAKKDSFVILACIEGDVQIMSDTDQVRLKKGDVVLLPADMTDLQFYSLYKFKILEASIAV